MRYIQVGLIMKASVKLLSHWLISGGLAFLPAVVSASALESPRSLSVNQNAMICNEIADVSALDRVKKHPYFKQYKQADWALPAPKSLWYREAMSATTHTQIVEIKNMSAGPVVITSVDGLAGDFSLSKVNGVIVAGALGDDVEIVGKGSATLEFTFSPLVASPITQQELVTLTFADGSEQDLYLWGELADGRMDTPITACGVLDTANTRYILQNDVSASASCFTVKATNITLDLNGYTITYGTGLADNSHGVMSGTNIHADAVGGQVEGLVIKNGTITQSGYHAASAAPADPTEDPAATSALVAAAAAAGKSNHGIYFTEQPYSHNIEITNLTINVIGHSSQAIRSLFRSGHHIHHNTFNSKVRTIENRHQLDGAIVYIAKSHAGDPGFSSLNNNTVIGGAQGGLYSANKQSQFYENQVEHYNLYTNGFGIYASADGSDAFDNSVTPDSGRGIGTSNNKVRLYDNTIEVQTLAINEEYGGCEMAVYGIQLEEGTVNTMAIDNTVTAIAGECGAKGLRVTDSPASGKNIIVGNHISALRESGVSVGIPVAASLEHNEKDSVLSFDNTYITDAVAVEAGWGGTKSFYSLQDSYSLGANPVAIGDGFNMRWFLRFGNHGDPARGILFEDAVLGAGLDKDLVLENKIDLSASEVYGTSQYSFASALNVSADYLGEAISIEYRDAIGTGVKNMNEEHVVLPISYLNRVNSTTSSRHEKNIDAVSIDVKVGSSVRRFTSVADVSKTYSCVKP